MRTDYALTANEMCRADVMCMCMMRMCCCVKFCIPHKMSV